jgi:hypothetical protein
VKVAGVDVVVTDWSTQIFLSHSIVEEVPLAMRSAKTTSSAARLPTRQPRKGRIAQDRRQVDAGSQAQHIQLMTKTFESAK